jgi:hypothetical protein
MLRRFGVPFIALGAALILNLSPVAAQTRSGGNWSGRNGNNTAQPSYPLSGSQPQQPYSPNVDTQQRGYSNAYQGQQGAAGYSNSRGNFNAPQQQYAPNPGAQQRRYSNGYQGGQAQGSYGYGYPRGNSYAAPDDRSYEPRYRGSHDSDRRRERRWRERMWRERSRQGWEW